MAAEQVRTGEGDRRLTRFLAVEDLESRPTRWATQAALSGKLPGYAVTDADWTRGTIRAGLRLMGAQRAVVRPAGSIEPPLPRDA